MALMIPMGPCDALIGSNGSQWAPYETTFSSCSHAILIGPILFQKKKTLTVQGVSIPNHFAVQL